MQKNTINLLIIGISIVCSRCTTPSGDTKAFKNELKMETAGWLIGSWQSISEEGTSIEKWEKKNDSTFAGISYFIRKADTLSYESISLEQRSGVINYIPTVKGQNDGLPVKFSLTSLTDKEFIFENPQHDFPKKIIYRKITNDSLVAEIWGIVNGKERSEKFPFARVK